MLGAGPSALLLQGLLEAQGRPLWGLLAFFVGIAFGWWAPGTQGKRGLFLDGLVIGVAFGLVMGVVGFAAGAPALGVGGFLGILVTVLVVTGLFVLGTWIGDVIERTTIHEEPRHGP